MANKSVSIEELNLEEAKQYIGGVAFVTILMTIGIIGNTHVLFVYSFKMKPSNHRIFIMALAVLDMITCSIGMPFIIVDLRNPLTFTMTSACKVLRFLNYFICTSSALILVVIAVERYRKICVPLGRQISQKEAKLCCVLVLVVALLLSWPAPVLYGASTVHLTDSNMTGTRCYTEDIFKNTKYQAYFNAVLILIVLGAFSVLVVLYSLIGRVILKHSTFSQQAKNKAAAAESTGSCTTTDTKDSTLLSDIHLKPPIEASSVSTGSCTGSEMDKQSKKTPECATRNYKNEIHSKVEQNKFNKMRKTTYMLFIITVVFFCSYFPHLILKIVTFAKKDFVQNMSFTEKVFYNTFIWCFFINNIANSIIYGFCDDRFRHHVFSMYRQLYIRLTKRV